ncbi:phosphonate utilization associated putative membrane protein [Hartmannibacter diazotrophicus]|uniref:Phosphonate utilization associated putative membrane protein n=1 Tax=Hartmannibacter diazotrophicus TaxID=1482074 RepID=A0A2C9DBA3_9HYPH|nr:phosphonate utilization associated putative membrane protein [Hartmannibacter diazotrophicus]
MIAAEPPPVALPTGPNAPEVSVPAFVVPVVLLGALLHASWNTIAKSGPKKFFNSVLICVGSAVISILLLPFVEPPAPESWPFIGVSVCLQIAYYSLIAAAYEAGDMSLAYPLMRGVSPLLVAVASGPLIGELLSLTGWLGVLLICTGVMAMAIDAGRRSLPNGKAIGYALLNAGVIASYTLVDGVGVRLSGSPLGYTMWDCILAAVPLGAYALWRHRGDLLRYARGREHLALVGGAATLGSYALALYAMTLAPVAMVAALRETSILFGAGLSYLVLKERVGWQRMTACAVLLCGVAAIRLA